jgi:hypothetical protein
MRYSSDKNIEALVKQLVKTGWHYCRRSKHGQLRPPQGRPALTVPCTPSDRRAFANFKRDVGHANRMFAR